jgi:hypothetical protein
MEKLTLPVKGCKKKNKKTLAYEQWSRALSREGFLLCHTCCDMEHRFF